MVNKNEVVDLYINKKLSTYKIADMLNFSASFIRKILIKEGIKLRSKKLTCFKKGHKHSEETKFRMSKTRRKNGHINQYGYKVIRCKNKTIKESHLMWLKYNQMGMNYIPKDFDVHHINGDKLDNRIENLICIPHEYHSKLHQYKRRREQW